MRNRCLSVLCNMQTTVDQTLHFSFSTFVCAYFPVSTRGGRKVGESKVSHEGAKIR